jgi:hypothetical protein
VTQLPPTPAPVVNAIPPPSTSNTTPPATTAAGASAWPLGTVHLLGHDVPVLALGAAAAFALYAGSGGGKGFK